MGDGMNQTVKSTRRCAVGLGGLAFAALFAWGCGSEDDTKSCDEPACPQGYAQVDNCGQGTDCIESEACGVTLLCEAQPHSCLVEPSCPSGFDPVETCDEAQPDCESVHECGWVIHCLQSCGDGCDAGDELAICDPSADDCYEVPSCDSLSSITCLDSALPAHGCPAEPATGMPCDEVGLECTYGGDDTCFTLYVCSADVGTPTWNASESACPDD